MSEIKIGRVASSNPTGLSAVKGFNRPAGNSMADIFKAQGVDPDALKKSLTPKLQEQTGRDLLNKQITARMGQKSEFGGKTVKVGDKYVAQTAAETKAAADAVKAGKQTKAQIEQALSKPTQITAEGIDASLGIGKQAKSAQESAGVFVKKEIEQALSKPTQITAEGIDAALGIAGATKSAEESAQVFIENGVGEVAKKKGLFGRIGDALKGAGEKIANFAKSKGGKCALIALGIAALAGLGYGLYKLLSKNKGDKVADTPDADPNKSTTPVAPTKPDEPTEPTTPVAPTEPDEPTEPEEDPNVHTVVKGDCVWNIAKAHLERIHKDDKEYKVTNKEILEHTNELMKWNNLHYEADNYRVLIYPGDKIRLTAPEEEKEEK